MSKSRDCLLREMDLGSVKLTVIANEGRDSNMKNKRRQEARRQKA